ncbi:MAG: S9 family peptidase, partial [Acidobacteriota bacterium]
MTHVRPRRASAKPSSCPTRGSGLLAAVTCLTLACLPSVAGNLMTPEHVARVRTVIDARISPAGGEIAFTLAVPRVPGEDDNGAAWTELHVVDTDGDNLRRFVGGEVNVSHVRWSPDGTWIGYLAKRGEDEHSSIWAIPLAGGESIKLVAHEESVMAFDWRPDGRALAFVAKQPLDDELDKQRDKGFVQQIYEEDWRAQQVYIAELPEPFGDPVENARALADLPGHAWHVAWSPDGTRVVTDLSPRPLTDDRYMFRRLHVVDVESGEVAAKIENPGKLGSFLFSTDGQTIVMISGRDINDPSAGRLMAASADGGPVRDLLPQLTETGQVEGFDFAKDGSIVYLASVGVGSQIGRLRADGSRHELIYASDGETGPVISTMSLDFFGRQLALVGESPRSPGNPFALEARADAKPAIVFDANPWLAELELGRQEIVRYPARDQLEIEGLLIHPVKRREGERVPLIVVAHGGPEAHYRNGWLTRYATPGQLAAGGGYAVFYPNYRGSTGRGVA